MTFNVKYLLTCSGVELEQSGVLKFAPIAGMVFLLSDGNGRESTHVAWRPETGVFEVTLEDDDANIDRMVERGWVKSRRQHERE